MCDLATEFLKYSGKNQQIARRKLLNWKKNRQITAVKLVVVNATHYNRTFEKQCFDRFDRKSKMNEKTKSTLRSLNSIDITVKPKAVRFASTFEFCST